MDSSNNKTTYLKKTTHPPPHYAHIPSPPPCKALQHMSAVPHGVCSADASAPNHEAMHNAGGGQSIFDWEQGLEKRNRYVEVTSALASQPWPALPPAMPSLQHMQSLMGWWAQYRPRSNIHEGMRADQGGGNGGTKNHTQPRPSQHAMPPSAAACNPSWGDGLSIPERTNHKATHGAGGGRLRGGTKRQKKLLLWSHQRAVSPLPSPPISHAPFQHMPIPHRIGSALPELPLL